MIEIINLADAPEWRQIVGRWIHTAFWQDSGFPPEHVSDLLSAHLQKQPIPLTLIAVENGDPVGSVSLIRQDMAERPELTPWLAALYVRPAYRRRGIGGRLVTALTGKAREAGFSHLYLSADDQIPFYRRHGFSILETGVGRRNLTIMRGTV
jgi:predicted N-acetyltransferase YhbS